MLVQCWATVYDAWPTLAQHWVNVPCLLGIYTCYTRQVNNTNRWDALALRMCLIYDVKVSLHQFVRLMSGCCDCPEFYVQVIVMTVIYQWPGAFIVYNKSTRLLTHSHVLGMMCERLWWSAKPKGSICLLALPDIISARDVDSTLIGSASRVFCMGYM